MLYVIAPLRLTSRDAVTVGLMIERLWVRGFPAESPLGFHTGRAQVSAFTR
jgi:hypothetical protein